MVLCCAESSPFTFIQTIANQENITYGNLIEINFLENLDLPRKTIMVGITLNNENFMYSVSGTSSALKLGNLKKY